MIRDDEFFYGHKACGGCGGSLAVRIALKVLGERTLLTLPEKRMEENARKKGQELFEYDEEGFPIKERWEMVSLHTARRTFITNVYLSGKFSVEFMMKLSGHTKYDTFKRYVRLSLDEYADDIAKSAENCLF